MSDDLLKPDVPPGEQLESETPIEDTDRSQDEAASGEEGLRPDEHFGLTPPG